MKQNQTKQSNSRLAIPFFLVMAVLAVAAMILPLRPKVSYREKRELASFPAFSMEAFVSGGYFRDIGLWYSDTFPGRETWLDISKDLESLHGYGAISIQGDLPEMIEVPDIPVPTKPAEMPVLSEPETEAASEKAATEQLLPEEETEPVLLDAIISDTSIIQIGGSAYHPLGFSQFHSDRIAAALSYLAAKVKDNGVRVISAPPPTSIGIDVDPAYLQMLHSADQGATLNYLHGSMSDDVITVDTHSALMAHKGEYLFFHSDHHWTGLAAYYCYEATCKALGMEPASLDSFTMIDEGEFQGSLYGRVSRPRELEKDTVYAYNPPGNVYMKIWAGGNEWYDGTIIRDMRNQNLNSKYLAFLESDQIMVRITNDDLPDAGNCLIVKDSFGNCLVPYFSQNYHQVYAIDYRKYSSMNMASFAEKYDIQDIIFAPNMMSTQSVVGADMIAMHCGYFK